MKWNLKLTALVCTVLLGGALVTANAVATTDAAPPDHDQHHQTVDDEKKTDVVDLKNEKCPVMGGEAKKDIYTDYKGLRVHFCCPGCEKKFLASPDEYLKKLGVEDVDEYVKKHRK